MKRRKNSPLIPAVLSSSSNSRDEDVSKKKDVDRKWELIKEHLDKELLDIKNACNMPLSKWLQWDTEDPTMIYMSSRKCQLRKLFRENDKRVLDVIELHKRCPIKLEDINLSDQLKRTIENLFMNPSNEMKESNVLMSMFPPNNFPKDRIGINNIKVSFL